MEVEQAELLVRMRKVRGGDELIAPGAFLPVASGSAPAGPAQT